MTNERAAVIGKYKFTDIFEALDKFLDIMQSRILTNRRHVRDDEPVEYQWYINDQKHFSIILGSTFFVHIPKIHLVIVV
ncbi:Imm59 family immunity protein [Latilactobacillus fuchuensis]|uniref:Imm59 family immunity protein n=1 Tax=Latilactobacillus fuchuensis TaxID=164393 RepID=UPI000557E4E6|nr:Imm59 family immunity protein [Latilactobacillus fuchuensis]